MRRLATAIAQADLHAVIREHDPVGAVSMMAPAITLPTRFVFVPNCSQRASDGDDAIIGTVAKRLDRQQIDAATLCQPKGRAW